MQLDQLTRRIRSRRFADRPYRGVVLATTVVALALAAAGCASKDTGSAGDGVGEAPIKVMLLAPISLASAPYQNALDAATARIDQQNADGGVNGHKIELISCDSQNDPNVAAQCARKAVSDGVVAFVGNQDYTGSTIWPVIEQAGIPSIGLRQVNDLDLISRYAFPVDASGPLTYGAAGAYLVANKACESVGWMGVDYGAASQAAINQAKLAVENVGGSWGSTQLFSANAADLAPQAAVALKDGNCFILAAGNLSPRSAQAIYAIDSTSRMIGTPDSLGGYLSTDAYGDSAAAVTQLSSLPLLDSASAGVTAFNEAMADTYPDSTLNNVSLRSWTAAGVFIEIAQAIDGDVTAQSVYDQLAKSTDTSTDDITPNIDFSKPKTYGDITRQFNTSLEAAEVTDGKLQPVGEGFFDALALVASN